MRKLLVLVLALSTAAVLAATAFAATKPIKVGDNYFVRSKGVPTVTINKGDKLRFSFSGDDHHNVKGKGISAGSSCGKLRDRGSCTSAAFNRKGTFTLYCSNHGVDDHAMKLKVR